MHISLSPDTKQDTQLQRRGHALARNLSNGAKDRTVIDERDSYRKAQRFGRFLTFMNVLLAAYLLLNMPQEPGSYVLLLTALFLLHVNSKGALLGILYDPLAQHPALCEQLEALAGMSAPVRDYIRMVNSTRGTLHVFDVAHCNLLRTQEAEKLMLRDPKTAAGRLHLL